MQYGMKGMRYMYIAPNSIIHILHGCPLDNTYRDTLYFTNATNQSAYFLTLNKYTLNNYTYVRKENVLRVEIRNDNLYDCNYIMFQNTSFGNKWFYAFITNTEYINNETSAITYEIDVMQTWKFDYTIHPSFVEREHTLIDEIGSNLVPDDFETGEYISDDFDGTGKMGGFSIVVASTFDSKYNDVAGGMYSNIYSGITYNIFTDYQKVNDFIDGAVSRNKGDGIVSVFMIPTSFVSKVGQPVKAYDIEKTKKIDNIDGYVPKNKKLFTYPYNFLYVTNLNGNSAEFRYEYFTGNTCKFGLVGDMSCNPQIILYPQNYKGVVANYNEKMILDGFPQCSYNTDSFKAWLAQTGASNMVNIAGSVGNAAISATANSYAASLAGATMSTSLAGPLAAVGAGMAIAGILASAYQHSTMPPQAHNGQGNSAMTALRIKDFAFMHMHIKREFAEIIDNYWNVYGYPSHKIKVPYTASRPHWNYVKTVGVCITGSIPVDDLARIKRCFNDGITFWKHGNEVGSYHLDNSIGGGNN